MNDVRMLCRLIVAGDLTHIPLLIDALLEDTSDPAIREWQRKRLNLILGELVVDSTTEGSIVKECEDEVKESKILDTIKGVKDRVGKLSERAEMFIDNKSIGIVNLTNVSPNYEEHGVDVRSLTIPTGRMIVLPNNATFQTHRNDYDNDDREYNEYTINTPRAVGIRRKFIRKFIRIFWQDIQTEGEYLTVLNAVSKK